MVHCLDALEEFYSERNEYHQAIKKGKIKTRRVYLGLEGKMLEVPEETFLGWKTRKRQEEEQSPYSRFKRWIENLYKKSY